jgi:hypothetical protein
MQLLENSSVSLSEQQGDVKTSSMNGSNLTFYNKRKFPKSKK